MLFAGNLEHKFSEKGKTITLQHPTAEITTGNLTGQGFPNVFIQTTWSTCCKSRFVGSSSGDCDSVGTGCCLQSTFNEHKCLFSDEIKKHCS